MIGPGPELPTGAEAAVLRAVRPASTNGAATHVPVRVPRDGPGHHSVTSVFSSEAPDWPTLGPAALHGLAGKVVRALEPTTEADPAHLLVSLLTGFGAAVGAEPHALAGNVRHPARLFAVIVGATAKSRKGTSWATVSRVLEAADPGFCGRVLGGWGSGEAVVDAVRDARDDDDSDAPVDKRILIHDGEYARFLRVASRDGSTLSMTARDAWDGVRLQARSRASTTVASDHHISLLAHITEEELRARLSEVEVANGFANRFLFVLGRQSRRLPEGGNLDDEVVQRLGLEVADALSAARRIGRLHRTPDARNMWAELYDTMADDDPGGLLGALIGRDQAQTLRLSVTYALLDGASQIDTPHLQAAWAVWQYCRASAAHVFGTALGDEVADRLVVAVREAGGEGLDRAAVHALFSRSIPKARIDRAVQTLANRGLVAEQSVATGGRPRRVLLAVPNNPKEPKHGG